MTDDERFNNIAECLMDMIDKHPKHANFCDNIACAYVDVDEPEEARKDVESYSTFWAVSLTIFLMLHPSVLFNAIKQIYSTVYENND